MRIDTDTARYTRGSILTQHGTHQERDWHSTIHTRINTESISTQIVSRGDILENASWGDKHSVTRLLELGWKGEQPGRNSGTWKGNAGTWPWQQFYNYCRFIKGNSTGHLKWSISRYVSGIPLNKNEHYNKPKINCINILLWNRILLGFNQTELEFNIIWLIKICFLDGLSNEFLKGLITNRSCLKVRPHLALLSLVGYYSNCLPQGLELFLKFY